MMFWKLYQVFSSIFPVIVKLQYTMLTDALDHDCKIQQVQFQENQMKENKNKFYGHDYVMRFMTDNKLT